MTIRKVITYGLLAILAGAFIFTRVKRINPASWGMHNKVNQPMFDDEAINGYDPVAYFTENSAVKGEKQFNTNWSNATWYFASKENEELFVANPDKYAPQFGGYCAYAMSKGYTANSDPNTFKIINDKLYLCSDPQLLKKWINGGSESMKASQENWR